MDQPGPSTQLALAVLATWRVTHLLSSEDGPGDVIYHLRAKLGSGFAGKLMDCFYCLSIWIAALVAAVLTRHFTDWALVCLALSGGACLLERATQERTASPYVSEGENDHGLLRSEEREFEEQSSKGRGEEAGARLETSADANNQPAACLETAGGRI